MNTTRQRAVPRQPARREGEEPIPPGVDPDLVPQPTQVRADAMKERAHLGEVSPPPVDPGVTPPVNRDVPAVTGPNGLGPAVIGNTLTCTMGNWDGEPTSYRYNWKSSKGTEVPIDLGPQTNSYVLVANDAGRNVFCVVTATNAGGDTAAPPSNSIAVTDVATARQAPEPKR